MERLGHEVFLDLEVPPWPRYVEPQGHGVFHSLEVLPWPCYVEPATHGMFHSWLTDAAMAPPLTTPVKMSLRPVSSGELSFPSLICKVFLGRCSVCLLDYQPEDRLQQIPACGHTFHMNCIDLWLANHRTCPLCRLSLSAKSSEMPNIQEIDPDANNEERSNIQSSGLRPTRHPDIGVRQNCAGEAESSANCNDLERGNAREQLLEA